MQSSLSLVPRLVEKKKLSLGKGSTAREDGLGTRLELPGKLIKPTIGTMLLLYYIDAGFSFLHLQTDNQLA